MAILQLAPSSGVHFVAEFLESPEEPISELAAIALGTSREEDAFELLRGSWKRQSNARLRRALQKAVEPRTDLDIDAKLAARIAKP